MSDEAKTKAELIHEVALLRARVAALEAAAEGHRWPETAAQESEALFRLLVESVQDYGIFLLDPAGHVLSWNRGAEQIKGYQAAEILGQHFSVFYPAEDVADGKPERLLALALAEGRLEDEGWRVRKDGSRFWADVVITTLRDAAGRQRGFAKVTRDLTERKQAEEERARHQEEIIRLQAAALAELSTPLIPITDEVLILPLIGTVDTRRAQQLMESLLTGVAAQQAHIVIIDLTGVAIMDTHVANTLIRVAQAVQLLGAQIVLTGMQPKIAETLVRLGIDLPGIVCRSTLQSGIAYATARREHDEEDTGV